MENIWTFVFAFAFFFLGVLLISSGLLLVNRNRIRGGSCSRLPTKDDQGCGTNKTCDICSPKKEKNDDDDLRQK